VRNRLRPAVDQRVARLLANARFELIPTASVDEQLAYLPPAATVTVTSSPGLGLERTLALSGRLVERGFAAVPHLSARLLNGTDHLGEVVRRLRDDGVREVFVVGGDSPAPAGPFGSALSLLRALAELEHRFERVGIAGYPEPHPLVPDRTLVSELLAKQGFASYVVTQICYEPATVVNWVRRMHTEGLRLPVYVGMPGAVDRLRLLRISLRVGVGDSVRYLKKQRGMGTRLVRRGGFRPDDLVAGLSTMLDGSLGDVAGFHINTFNQVEGTERWRREVIEGVRP
jgi:methylenetetrahydrofolate reductase (NADPH)